MRSVGRMSSASIRACRGRLPAANGGIWHRDAQLHRAQTPKATPHRQALAEQNPRAILGDFLYFAAGARGGNIAPRRVRAYSGGREWDHRRWPGHVLPLHEWIDSVTPNNPVFIEHLDGHEALTNALALRGARVSMATPIRSGGRSCTTRRRASPPGG